MAGYIFNIGETGNVKEMFKNGFYSTYIKTLAANPFEGTFADYISMSEGDNVYFFQKRKLYGIGKFINVGEDCKYNNYIGASILKDYTYDEIRNSLLIDFGADSSKYRWICFFKEGPAFIEKGLDMDEVLQYKPNSFKALRTNWKKTFIKIDDEENKALKELFYLRVFDNNTNYNVHQNFSIIEQNISHNHKLNYKDLIISTKRGDKLSMFV